MNFTVIILLGMVSDHLAQIINHMLPLNSIYIQILFFICFYIILFTLLRFIVHRVKNYIRDISLTFISKVILSILACITVIVLYLNIFVPKSYEEIELTKINLIIQVSYLLIISVLSMFIVKNIKAENQLKYQKMKQAQFNDYMHSLEQVNKDMQKFRHDYLNILTTISGYIAIEDMEQLKNYFNEKIVKMENETLQKNLLLKELSNLKIIELKGLLTTKLILSIEKNINIHIEVPEEINIIPIDIIDYSRIIGILIDNAIEASEKSTEPIINIVFFQTSDATFFVIENSFEVQVDISRIYEEGFSTKQENRGYGLNNVMDIKKNYPNLMLNTSIEDNLFVQELELKNGK